MPTPDALPFPPIPALVSSYSMQCNHWHVRSRKSPHILLKYTHAQVRDSNAHLIWPKQNIVCPRSVLLSFLALSWETFLPSPLPPSIARIPDACLFVSCLNMLVYCGSFVYRNTPVGLLQCNPFHTESPILKRGKQIMGHKGFRPMTLGLLLLWCHCE